MATSYYKIPRQYYSTNKRSTTSGFRCMAWLVLRSPTRYSTTIQRIKKYNHILYYKVQLFQNYFVFCITKLLFQYYYILSDTYCILQNTTPTLVVRCRTKHFTPCARIPSWRGFRHGAASVMVRLPSWRGFRCTASVTRLPLHGLPSTIQSYNKILPYYYTYTTY